MLEYLYSSEARKHRLNEVVVGRLECWKGKKERGEEGFCPCSDPLKPSEKKRLSVRSEASATL